MLRSHIRVLVVASALAALLVPASARGGGTDAAKDTRVRVDRIAGETVSGDRLVSLDEKKLTLATSPAAAPEAPEAAPPKIVDVPLDDVVEVLFPTPTDPDRAWAPMEVALDLWSGESILGELKGGDGERVELDSPLLGRLKLPLEGLAAVRFLQRLAQAADAPDLRAREDADVVHLVGGDQFSGTIEGFGAKGLKSVTPQKETIEVPYERLVAVCLLADPRTKPETGTQIRVALRDGTRVAGATAKVESGRFRLKSASGFDVDCAVADVVALQTRSPRFSFLSEVPPATTVVKPVWEVAAGDPAILFAPRFDRSFSGRPLRCGGRTWLDGIGAFSGTTLTWNLDGRFSEFRTSAGLDDGAGPLGGVVFQVLVDGKEAWNSGFVRPAGTDGRGAASPVASPRIPLTGAKTLSLVVLAGDSQDPYPVQDEADWLGPVLVRAPVK
jgi:hypothetical protein